MNVCVEINPEKIDYTVKNSKLPEENILTKSGIGLQNVNRRLELSYPEKYLLNKHETDEVYEVHLTIEI